MVVVECLDEGVEGAVVFYCWSRALMLPIESDAKESDAKVVQGIVNIQRFVETCRHTAYFGEEPCSAKHDATGAQFVQIEQQSNNTQAVSQSKPVQ